MSLFKRISALACAALLLLGTAPVALGAPAENARSVVESYIRENKLPADRIMVGYYNTVTGEEYYHNGDEYVYPASIYKVALCMYWAEKVHNGELAWTDRIRGGNLENMVTLALEESDNAAAANLFQAISEHLEEYRRTLAPLYSLEEELPPQYVEKGENTPRQIIRVLQKLYAEPERYPTVIDHMLQAEQSEFFLRCPLKWKVAHKYGYLDGPPLIINDCGIVYTPQPFLLVVMTRGLKDAVPAMSELCGALARYTAGETEEPDPTAAPEPTPSPQEAAPTPRAALNTLPPLVTASPAPVSEQDDPGPMKQRALLLGGAAAGCLLAYTLLTNRRK